jgi:diacylglycerol kinase
VAEERPGQQPLRRSFYNAFRGIGQVVRRQRNARIHALAAALALLMAAILKIGLLEWALLVIVIILVWSAELMNSAIEAAVDLAQPKLHPMARLAKDAAAGAVLLAALAALLVGGIIFLPRLAPLLLGKP